MKNINVNSKKKVVLISGVIVFLIAVISVVVISCLGGAKENNDNSVNIYFLNSSTNEIVSEKRTIPNGVILLQENKKQEYIDAVKDEFMKGPKNTGNVIGLSDNISVISCKFQEISDSKGNVEINFSKEYNELEDGQKLAFLSAISKTFTDLGFVDTVNVVVDGEKIQRDNSEPVEDIKNETIEVNPHIEPYKTDNLVVKLYFSDEQAMGLCAEERDITIKEKESVERRIVEELIKGPTTDNLYEVIPPETKINNINTEGGICYVDLSKEFVSQHNGGSTEELLTIYSIVNSLTELDQVKQVQFLIDGVKETSLAGHVDFSKTFERDENRILKDE